MVMVMPATAVRRAHARVSASPVSFASDVARKAFEFEAKRAKMTHLR